MIDLKHRATPFNENFLTSKPHSANPMQSLASNVNNASLSRELSFLESKRKHYLEDLERFRNFNVSEHYFSNISDLRHKLYKTNNKVLISESFAPNNSNDLFNRIEKFDVADNYKKEPFQTMPDIQKMLNDQKNLFNEIKSNEPHNSLEYFKTMRKFRLEPELGPVSQMQPPLLRNRSPHKLDPYHRHKFLQAVPNRAKTAQVC